MRIVPKQQTPLTEGLGYGFMFEGRAMKWETPEEAFIAAYILRVHPGFVCNVQTIFPKTEEPV